jgi:hypothetical protein
MNDDDALACDIDALMALQRDAWGELACPTLTTFDRREIRNRIRQSEVELRDHLKIRTERLRIRPRPAEPAGDSLSTLEFRFFRPRLALEHDPEKCVAVFRKDHAQTKSLSAMTIQPNLIAL